MLIINGNANGISFILSAILTTHFFLIIDAIELINGTLPRKQQRLVEAWIELHQGELLENWERLQSGQLPYKIAPLK